ncbi:MAG: septum formation protein Maf [Planctomycetes bacterium]|nr:septum formation protein Maf [Planctomycetota bacterium]
MKPSHGLHRLGPVIILASASRRRSRILTECGIAHRVVVSNVMEIMMPHKGAGPNALANACLKARAVASAYAKSTAVKAIFIIGADTIVQCGRRLFGKARSRQQSKQFLEQFSDKTVRVYTGLCVIEGCTGRAVSAVDCSQVRVKRLTPNQINRFMKVAGPHNLAGGFSIEGPGALIFDDVRGSFYNILGLPMMKLAELFAKLDINLLGLVNRLN